ncbi:hypothetical protein F2P56_024959 [Juglans regia]|uniref:Bromodomain and WD repeat-containing protein 3-like n=2 Tax=Juglans regia TaxID=51240 RepID=A0A2I4GQG7_JUGRE|nr:bromodomain and WD repeat-containing protein 3-like [Juglans regia]KAF5455370.1 hypothetical protein F2P56_024959 [Juglans regia]
MSFTSLKQSTGWIHNMDSWKCVSSADAPSHIMAPLNFSNKVHGKDQSKKGATGHIETEVDIDLREVYFLILHFLSSGPCQRTFGQFCNELLEHQLLPRRYHAWFSSSGAHNEDDDDDDGISFPLSYNHLVERYPHIEKDHLVRLLKQLIASVAPPFHLKVGGSTPNAADVPTLLGSGSFSLLDCERNMGNKQVKPLQAYLRWPHMQADQVRGLSLREIGGGFTKHHRAPSIRSACYAVAKPLTMVQKMQNKMKLRGHRSAVYCAIFDRLGRYVITGSDDRLVKIWSMETAFSLASCRGHEGDITDLAVSSNNALVASASNDFVIRVWRLPDGMPISVLRGHTGAVTAIVFSPRPSAVYQLLSSSDDGTCRIWDARYSQCKPRIYTPKPSDVLNGKSSGPSSNGPSSSNGLQSHQILCCAYNANGTVFVTGSSDTFARVWNAFKSSPDDSDQPMHEMDVLSGHENDVNYVQFSGCAVASKTSMSDSLKEENIPKFKNSWFCHDNIVTCSRDGSAIIWVPRSRRSHGKVGRWTRAYHLKVPPPPLPPQPPRGGPRHRFLPTPRGVNMIVWSLDNRFVLAAIMDCRICVWNAVDGSLVHSLTGHSESSYVLDVHPFNPRIAMSAGYDGRTIVWDIWEGTPIWTYDIGRFKLVDGKFSPDGTSIVLSDDVGQIYLLNTGQGESQKDAKMDQFFLGDYRPLIRDAMGNVLDQESQLPPHRRNIQDPLCDSSMMPYPEPYQSMYQKRRLGALGIEWQPSSVKYAVGLDFGLGQDDQMLPLADLERMIEPLPEFVDAMYWEPENEVIISDDNDSEYNVAEENFSEGDQASISASSSSDLESTAEDSEVERSHRDSLRRSRRKKHKTEVESMTSSGRRVKKRNLNECDGTVSWSNRTKKSRSSQKVSKRKSSKAKTMRPQRVAALNALNMFSRITGTSSDGEDENDSENDSSDSELLLQDSNLKINRTDANLQNMQWQSGKEELSYVGEFTDVPKPPELSEPHPNVGSKRRLLLKFSLRDSKKHVSPEDARSKCENQAAPVFPSSRPHETSQEDRTNKGSIDPMSSFTDIINVELSQNQIRSDCMDKAQSGKAREHSEAPAGDEESKHRWEEVNGCASKCSRSGDLMPRDAFSESVASFDVQKENKNDMNGDEEQFGTDASAAPYDGNSDMGYKDSSRSDQCRDKSLKIYEVVDANHSNRLNENAPLKPTKLIIRTKKRIATDPKSPSKLKFTTTVEDLSSARGENIGTSSSLRSQHLYSDMRMSDATYGSEKFYKAKTDLEGSDNDLEENTATFNDHHDVEAAVPEASNDATHRTRSIKIKATSWEPNVVKHSFKLRSGRASMGTSINAEKSSMELSDQFLQGSRSTRNQHGGYNDYEPNSSARRKLNHFGRKLSWLMLSEHEEGYRYIPQLGDEVVYLRQGHEEFIESSLLSEIGPWRSINRNLSAVEVCKVKGFDYATLPGSGDSCCKIKLEFSNPSVGFGKAFELTLPELIDFPDFVVEKTRYDAAIRRNWTHRDKCLVWWRNPNGEGGKWWEGRILSSKPKSQEFPDSPWERYTVSYRSDPGDNHLHCPWELHDPDILWEHPHIDDESRDKLLSLFAKLERPVDGNKDYFGLAKLNHAAQKSDFSNRFPVPLYPELICSRLKNEYYRSLEAVKHDIMVMLSNAESYFSHPELGKMRRLSDWFKRKLSRL